ncbi:hypothetical protein [Rufibacter tibetensis]|uniref:Uncharacterized protein n=1 Tax=Rufibacter tibetensis TaxID=512763 RepID=A0A0P0CYY5_9BACT|nr:hypothetical protein [Rufibacter tibetensis]ALI99748.1 hypothetical protein DC20_13165 [Rufibacter tibetensis]
MMLLVLALGALFFVIFYLVGSVFLLHGLKKEAGFIQHVVNFWVGLLIIVSFYAIIKTRLVTILFLIPIVLLLFKKSLVSFLEVKQVLTWKVVLYSVGIYIAIFFLQFQFNLDALHNPLDYVDFIHPEDGERYIYSTVLSLVHYKGVETVSPESVLTGASGVSLYHFLEFWLGSLFKTVYNVNSDIVLFYFVYPVFKTFTVIAVFSVFAEEIENRYSLCIIIIVLFCFTTMGFRWVFPPVYKNDLRNIVTLPIVVLVCKLLYLRKFYAVVVLLMIASVVNILFLPLLVISGSFFFKSLNKTYLVSIVVFLVFYMVFFYVFKESIQDKYFSLSLSETLKFVADLPLVKNIYRILLLSVLSYPFRLLVAFYIMDKYHDTSTKKLAIDFGNWMLLCFVTYNLLYGLFLGLSIDAYQFQSIAYLIAKVSLLLLLFYLVQFRKYIVCIVILLLMTDYTYPFGKIKPSRSYDLNLEMKIASIGKGKFLKGLFIDEYAKVESRWYLYYYPTHATDYARANDYRMYLFNYDITGIKASMTQLDASDQKILEKTFNPLFPLACNIIENIHKYKISIVWISKKSKYLIAFKNRKPLHELEEYLVYYINPA